MNPNDQTREVINKSTDQTADQELLERYEEQQRRLACPTCGEEPFRD